MMFGLRIPFHYAQCADCGSLWLTDPPTDFTTYYPADYYSFQKGRGVKAWFKTRLRAERDRAYFGRSNLFGEFLARRYKDAALRSVSKLIEGQTARILDVGCGNGQLLCRMAMLGFQFLVGVDPLISEELNQENGVRLRKCQLEDLKDEEYDLAMFHHSLEHIADPRNALQAAARLLAPDGRCLVRLPVVAHAWEKYGTNWVQLDPPRHMWVPTDKTMRILAESVGLDVESVEYDSTEFQFWGSELHARGIPLKGINSASLEKMFRREELIEFRNLAAYLNSKGQGDQAAFVLKKVH